MDAVKLMNELIPNNENSLYNIESLEEYKLGHIDIEGERVENIFDFIEDNTLVIAKSINGFFRAK